MNITLSWRPSILSMTALDSTCPFSFGSRLSANDTDYWCPDWGVRADPHSSNARLLLGPGVTRTTIIVIGQMRYFLAKEPHLDRWTLIALSPNSSITQSLWPIGAIRKYLWPTKPFWDVRSFGSLLFNRRCRQCDTTLCPLWPISDNNIW